MAMRSFKLTGMKQIKRIELLPLRLEQLLNNNRLLITGHEMICQKVHFSDVFALSVSTGTGAFVLIGAVVSFCTPIPL